MERQEGQILHKTIRWDEISELHRRAAECKRWRDFAGVISLREEISRILEEDGASVKALASSWNYLAAGNLALKRYAEAEHYARKSVSYYEGHDGSCRETLATYLGLLARILACQRKFDEAVMVGERAVTEYSVFHGHQGDYVIARKADVEEYRQRMVPEAYEL